MLVANSHIGNEDQLLIGLSGLACCMLTPAMSPAWQLPRDRLRYDGYGDFVTRELVIYYMCFGFDSRNLDW